MSIISSFELDVDTRDGGRRKYRLHRTGGEVKAKVTRREPGGGRVVERGKRAVAEAERLLGVMAIDPSMSESQLLERACSAMLLQADDVEHLDVDIEFTTHSAIQAFIAAAPAASDPTKAGHLGSGKPAAA